jgi:hypothetical protein
MAGTGGRVPLVAEELNAKQPVVQLPRTFSDPGLTAPLSGSKSIEPHPIQRQLSEVELLQQTRYTPILHSSLREFLPTWKTRVALQPRWPHKYHKYHLWDGLSLVDSDHIQVSSRDIVVDGLHRRGTRRLSCGEVHFLYDHMDKIRLDAEDLVWILTSVTKRHAQGWTVKDLDFHFRKSGRLGMWQQYAMPLYAFLAAFPKTFEQYGTTHQYVRLKFGTKGSARILDDMNHVMSTIARYNESRTVFQQYNHTHAQPSRTYTEGADGHGFGLHPTGPGPTNERMLADTGYAGPKHVYTHTFQGFREELPPLPQPAAKLVRFPEERIPFAKPPHVRHKLAAALDVRNPIPTKFATEKQREPSHLHGGVHVEE